MDPEIAIKETILSLFGVVSSSSLVSKPGWQMLLKTPFVECHDRNYAVCQINCEKVPSTASADSSAVSVN